jgi:hypothetical protein
VLIAVVVERVRHVPATTLQATSAYSQHISSGSGALTAAVYLRTACLLLNTLLLPRLLLPRAAVVAESSYACQHTPFVVAAPAAAGS